MTCHLTEKPKEGYRLGVGIVLLSSEGRIFVGRRIDISVEAWQMPQGGIDKNETPEEAGLREMDEEIGTSQAKLLASSRYWRSYDLPKDIAGRIWGGRYLGQTQKWLLYRFEGDDDAINLTKHTPEFMEWRWLSEDQLLELIVVFKRDLYASVFDEFRHLWV